MSGEQAFPSSLDSDPEDVAWALSTGQAMWARGDFAEAARWVKKASENAFEAGEDDRALFLARSAAELRTLAPPTIVPPAPMMPVQDSPVAAPPAPPPAKPRVPNPAATTMLSATNTPAPAQVVEEIAPQTIPSDPPAADAAVAPPSKIPAPPRVPTAAPAPPVARPSGGVTGPMTTRSSTTPPPPDTTTTPGPSIPRAPATPSPVPSATPRPNSVMTPRPGSAATAARAVSTPLSQAAAKAAAAARSSSTPSRPAPPGAPNPAGVPKPPSSGAVSPAAPAAPSTNTNPSSPPTTSAIPTAPSAALDVPVPPPMGVPSGSVSVDVDSMLVDAPEPNAAKAVLDKAGSAQPVAISLAGASSPASVGAVKVWLVPTQNGVTTVLAVGAKPPQAIEAIVVATDTTTDLVSLLKR